VLRGSHRRRAGTTAPQDEWYTYRHDNSRTGAQPFGGNLSDWANLDTLHCVWSFPPDGLCGSQPAESPAGAFTASPIVVNDTVFIGSTSGHFYALDAKTGALKWQCPKMGDKPLVVGVPDGTAFRTAR
jgi:glucose dehydrogenase